VAENTSEIDQSTIEHPTDAELIVTGKPRMDAANRKELRTRLQELGMLLEGVTVRLTNYDLDPDDKATQGLVEYARNTAADFILAARERA
jgi:hypothetical protein